MRCCSDSYSLYVISTFRKVLVLSVRRHPLNQFVEGKKGAQTVPNEIYLYIF